MPLQIIPQQNQPQGLAMLGGALAQAGGDFAARRDRERVRQEALATENRRRGYQLDDVASNRTYEQEQFDRLRGLQLSDEERRREQQLGDEKRRREEGKADTLTRAQMERRLQMLGEAEKRGLFDGKMIGNIEAEDAALTALQTQLAEESKFTREQPGNAQAALAELGTQKRDLVQKLSAVEAVLSERATVDQAAVAARAVALATQANGGNTPTREQITAAQADAYKEAQQAAMLQDYQEKEAARVQYQILSSQLNTIRQQEANLTSTFRVAPTASPLSAAPTETMTTPAPAGRGDPMGGFQSALDGLMKERGMGQGRGTAGANSSLQAIQDVTAARATAPTELRPILDQTKTSMLADAYEPFDETVNATTAKLADVDSQISRLQSGRPNVGVSAGNSAMSQFYAMPGAQYPSGDPGRELTSLLQQRAQLQRQLSEEEKARRQGRSSLLQLNTPAQSRPLTFPTPGAAVSNLY